MRGLHKSALCVSASWSPLRMTTCIREKFWLVLFYLYVSGIVVVGGVSRRDTTVC